MSGAFSNQSEIIWCANQSLTEMPEPNSVHDYSSGYGVLRIDNPLGQ